MSDVTVPVETLPVESKTKTKTDSVGRKVDAPPSVERNEFEYRPVPVLAPVSFFLGVASFISLFGTVGLGFGLMGLVLGTACLIKIRRSNGEYGGMLLASGGVALSSLFLVAGTAVHVHAYQSELPEGFNRVNFRTDVARKEVVVENQQASLHPDVAALIGKRVFLKGYMYPTGKQRGLESFMLLESTDQCCFGGQPKPTDRIAVEMGEGRTAEYYPGRLVSVAGEFQAHMSYDPSTGQPAPEYGLVDVEHFEPSRSSF